MQRTKLVGLDTAKQIEAASAGTVSFDFKDKICTGFTVKVNDEFTVKAAYRDYSVEILQILPNIEYCLSYEAVVGGETVTVTKKFEDRKERDEYLNNTLTSTQQLSAIDFIQDIFSTPRI